MESPAEPRQAQCECRQTRPSADVAHNPFYREHPTRPFDSFYCGCRGWD